MAARNYRVRDAIIPMGTAGVLSLLRFLNVMIYKAIPQQRVAFWYPEVSIFHSLEGPHGRGAIGLLLLDHPLHFLLLGVLWLVLGRRPWMATFVVVSIHAILVGIALLLLGDSQAFL